MPQTAFGPLIEPANPEGPDLGKTFINAFQVGASINARQRQLENQLASYALRAQNAEHDRELDYAKFGLAQQQADINASVKIQNAETAANRLTAWAEDKVRDDKWREQRYNQEREARGKLAGAKATLAERGLYPGMKGYDVEYAKLTEGLQSFLDKQTYDLEVRTQYDAHNKNAATTWNNFRQLETSYAKDRSATLYNNALEGGDNPILYPETLEPETKSTGLGGWLGIGGTKKTGRLLVPQPGGGTLPVATSEITRLAKARKELLEKKDNLPQTVHRPDVAVYDIGYKPAPANPADAEENEVYITPDGNPHRRVNGQWVNP